MGRPEPQSTRPAFSARATHPFLTAEWRDLVMLNYEISPGLIEPLVPAGVEMDRWRGTLYVSVVGFLFRETRVLGLGIPGHRTFEEVNLRFYVRRHVGDEVRRGVVFVRELVPRHAIALVARALYNEPYRAVPMRHRIETDRGETIREYAWRTGGAWTGFSVRTVGAPKPLGSDSEAEFITEHYWGYTRQRNGGTVEYRVDHPRWTVWNASDVRLSGDFAEVYGRDLAHVLDAPPQSAFVAGGSAVTVFRPTKIR